MVLDRLSSFVKNLGQTPDDDGGWWPVPATRPAGGSEVERASRERSGGGVVDRFTVEMVTPGRGGSVGCGMVLLVPAVLAAASALGLLGTVRINAPQWVSLAIAGVLGVGGVYFLLGLLTPTLRVLADRETFDPAESHTLAWSFARPPRGVRRLRVRLAGQERATYSRGTDTTTDTHAFYKEVLFDSRDEKSPITASGVFGFQLPPGVMHSFRSNHNEIRWTLEIKAWVTLLPDVRRNIVLTVWPGDDPRGYFAAPQDDSHGAVA